MLPPSAQNMLPRPECALPLPRTPTPSPGPDPAPFLGSNPGSLPLSPVVDSQHLGPTLPGHLLRNAKGGQMEERRENAQKPCGGKSPSCFPTSMAQLASPGLSYTYAGTPGFDPIHHPGVLLSKTPQQLTDKVLQAILGPSRDSGLLYVNVSPPHLSPNPVLTQEP